MTRGKKTNTENKKNNEINKAKRTDIKIKITDVRAKRVVKKTTAKKPRTVVNKSSIILPPIVATNENLLNSSLVGREEEEELELEKLPLDVKGWVAGEGLTESKMKDVDNQKIEREKKLIMWSGVTFFMVVIFGLWIFNINLVLKRQPVSQEKSQLDIEDIANNFNNTMNEISKSLNNYDSIASSTATSTSVSTSTTSSAILPESDGVTTTVPTSDIVDPAQLISPEEVQQLKKQLE